MRKQVVNVILLVIVIVFTIDLFHAYTHLSNRREQMQSTQIKLDELSNQQQDLQRKLAGTNTTDFLEQEAREKLNMSKAGEIVILLPTISIAPSPSPTPVLPVWEQWVNLFK